MRVSVIMPCFNEERFIARSLKSILSNGYSHDRLEVIVVDGMSEDGTRDILREYALHDQRLRIIDNAKRITSCGLNRAIEASTGEALLWFSAHNEYDQGYISKCVHYLMNNHVDVVGGTIRTVSRESGLIARSISMVLSVPFGVGNSYFRTGVKRPMLVDAVFGACYRRTVFDRVGMFNENLVRGQDLEFSMRMRASGLKVLLAPDLCSTYYARSRYGEFLKHNYVNGMWAVLPFHYAEVFPVSYRHLIPMFFVFGLVAALLLAAVSSRYSSFIIVVMLVYAFFTAYFAFREAVRVRDWRFTVILPLMFLSLHLSYGMGSVVGLVKLFFSMRFWRLQLSRLLRQCFRKSI